MRNFLYPTLIFLCTLTTFTSKAQNTFKAIVKDSSTNETISRVTISVEKSKTIFSDKNGFFILKDIQNGNHQITLSAVGYFTKSFSIDFSDTTLHLFLLVPKQEQLTGVVVISSTRSNERIETATTKTEVLAPEEVAEEAGLKPANIASILGDVSGVQIQQSSAASGNANVRIQGLDGRYTQILKDGMPLYGGYAGGFGILSVAPLDLKQIELIKGSSSTLYGGGAIGGLVNLISKKPAYKPDAAFLINASTLKEKNINAYYAQRWNKIGFTFFGGQTFQDAVDVDGDGLTDVSKNTTTMIHPTLFIYPTTKSNIAIGWSGGFDNRIGGDISVIKNGANANHIYFEKNVLQRNIFTLTAEQKVNNKLTFHLKSSLSNLNRNETTTNTNLDATQKNYYTEISISDRNPKYTLVGGINITGDKFSPNATTASPSLTLGEYGNNTIGAFTQITKTFFKATKIETGIRYDHHNKYGNFVLPRIAIFQKINDHWGSRAGFGMGYTTPNPLTPQIKDVSIFEIEPIAAGLIAEKSYAFNAEINYKKEFDDEKNIFINAAFFSTSIKDPIVREVNSINNKMYFSNKPKPLTTRGIDTYIQLKLHAIEIYLGYTYTDAQRKYLPNNNVVLLTPKHRLATVISYEIEGKLRAGIEASYSSSQHRLEDYTNTPGYLFVAGMVEKKFGPKWSLVANVENLLNVNQSNYEKIYSGSILNPNYKALWAPIDGRALNISLRFQPFAK